MKKALAAALAATFVLSVAGSVFAAPVDFDGKIQYQNRFTTRDGFADVNENRFKFILNGKTEVAEKTNFYFRMSAEALNGGDSHEYARDYNGGFHGQEWGDQTAIGFLDQFGVEVQNAGWNYKVGRQDAFIGANGLIYDSTYGVGKHIFSDGITVTGKSGVTSLSAVALQVDQNGKNDPKIYALSASYNPTKDLTVGTTLAKWDNNGAKDVGSINDMKFWDVNASYNFDSKLNGYAEYAKSDADNDNKAYVYGLNYSVDNKNSLWALYAHVEPEGNIRDQFSTTTFDNNREGMQYGLGHKINNSTTLNLFYSDMKFLDTKDNITSFRTTVNYKF